MNTISKMDLEKTEAKTLMNPQGRKRARGQKSSSVKTKKIKFPMTDHKKKGQEK